MKKKLHASWFQGAALASLAAASATGQVTVYDNTSNPLDQYFASQREMGDEIKITNPGWVASSFSFEYYASGLSGDEVGRVRFYRNDGVPVEGTTAQAPGSLFYESPPISFINGNYPIQIIDLAALNIVLPEDFTWSVKVNGLASGEVFGLKLYDNKPNPVIGSSLNDYWLFSTEGWVLQTLPGVTANFGAQLEAVPEPTTLTLLGLGGLALLLRRRCAAR